MSIAANTEKAGWTKLLKCHTPDHVFFFSFWQGCQPAILRASTWNLSVVYTKWGTDLIYYPSWAKITVNTEDGYMHSLYKHSVCESRSGTSFMYFSSCTGASSELHLLPHIIMVPLSNAEVILKSAPLLQLHYQRKERVFKPFITLKCQPWNSNDGFLLEVMAHPTITNH